MVTEDGCKVRLAGVTWFGMQTQYFVPGGLDFLSYKAIIDEIAALGFNSYPNPADRLPREVQRRHPCLAVHQGQQGP